MQVLDVDWRRYEVDAQKEFNEVEVDLGTVDEFPVDVERPKSPTGTILRD